MAVMPCAATIAIRIWWILQLTATRRVSSAKGLLTTFAWVYVYTGAVHCPFQWQLCGIHEMGAISPSTFATERLTEMK